MMILFRTLLFLGCLFLGTSPSFADPVSDGHKAYQAGNYELALQHWLPAAKKGNARAQFNMGILFENGLTTSTPRNDGEAGRWYLLAAQQNFPPAMTNLAHVQLRAGHSQPALTWLNLAARWNDPTAIASLGRLGYSVPTPDLAVNQQQNQAQMGTALGQILGCLLGRCQQASPAVKCRTVDLGGGLYTSRCN